MLPSTVHDISVQEHISIFGLDLSDRPNWIQFAVLCAAVFAVYVTFGFMQELIFQLDGVRPYVWHLTMIQFLIYTILAFLEFYLENGARRRIPINIYIQMAFYTVVTIGLSNAAVAYLNYPTQVVFKSCKLIPVLIGGIFIQGKKFNFIDFTAVLIMSIGLIIFMLSDSQVSPIFSSTGYFMISFSLIADAAIGNVQEKYIKSCNASNSEVVLYSFSIGFIFIVFIVLCCGNFVDGFLFFAENPLKTYGYGIIFALLGYLGVNIILTLIRTQGALIAATVTTMRKAITIALSFIIFVKPFTFGYLLGGLTIMFSVYLSMYNKNRSKWDGDVKGRIVN